MRILHGLLLVGCVALAGLAGLCLSGCEASSATEAVEIEPATAVMSLGDSREFVATHGYTFTWSLEHEDVGLLNTRTGDRVVYTVTATNLPQVLHVRSTIPGTASSGTATSTSTSGTTTNQTTAYEVDAQAMITYPNGTSMPSQPTTAVTTLVISPTSQTLSTNKVLSVPFAVTGGDGNYAWSVKDPALGGLSATSGSVVTYTNIANQAGSQSIFVASAGTIVSATVTQQ